jgi:ArsR family transcriptional regulator
MSDSLDNKISTLFDSLRQPARVQILLTIRDVPACVCHIMAALGLRQASISQHLMVLRKQGLVSTQREGRNIYYKLAEPRLVDLIEQAATIAGIPVEDLNTYARHPLPDCPCPKCHPEFPPDYSCSSYPLKKKSL